MEQIKNKSLVSLLTPFLGLIGGRVFLPPTVGPLSFPNKDFSVREEENPFDAQKPTVVKSFG